MTARLPSGPADLVLVAPIWQTARMNRTSATSLPPQPGLPGRSGFRRRLLAAAALLAGLAGIALAVDLPVARWCRTARLPREPLRLVNFAEAFAHGTGAAALLVVVLVLDPRLRLPRPGRRLTSDPGARDFVRMIAATFSGGLMVDGVKALVERVRPRAADLAAVDSAWGTFGVAALLPHSTGHADVSSFPSGHAAVAAGFAAALSWRYPRGAVIFAVIAFLAATQRVVSSAHYPSDVACGAAIGLLGAALCLGDRGGSVESPASS